MKRVLSWVLTLAMMVSLLAVDAFAAEWDEAYKMPVAVLSVDGVDGSDPNALIAGDQVRVTLTLQNMNIYWNSYQFQLNYDDSKVELDMTEKPWGSTWDVATNCKDIKDLFAAAPTPNTSIPGALIIGGSAAELNIENYWGMLLPGDDTNTYLRDITALTTTFTVKEDCEGSAIFSIALDEDQTFYQIGFTMASGLPYVNTSTDDLTESINIIKANTIAISGSDTIAVPTANDSPATMQYSATVVDGYGDVLKDPVVNWTIDRSSEAVTISNNGLVTVTNKAQAGTYTIKAEATREDNNTLSVASVTAEAKLEVTKEDPAAADVTVSLGESPVTLTIPDNNATANAEAVITTTVTDQYGDNMDPSGVTYSIFPEVEGVSVNADGTQVVVTNAAKNEIETIQEFTLTAEKDGAEGEATFTVQRAGSVADSIQICKDGKPITADSIAIPQSGESATVSYTAQVLDQYGETMDEAVTWEFTGTLNGVTTNPNAGNSAATVTVGSGATTGSLTLKATSGSVSKEITISIVNIAFSGVEDAITVKEDATYGDTWDQIVTIDESKITAKVGEKEIKGTYSLVQTDSPDAGNQTYQVVFKSTDGTYSNTEVTTGTVNVAKRDVTVSGITAQNKVYDGNNTASLVYTGAQINGMIEGDTLSVAQTATGTFADKKAGTGKTVTITGVALDGAAASNYNLTATTLTAKANITPKAVTVSGITAANKEYDGTTAATLDCSAAQIDGAVTGDNLTVASATGTFADKNVGTDKAVTVSRITLGGTDAGNYTASVSGAITADITATGKYDVAATEEQNVVVGIGTFAQPTASFKGESVSGTWTYAIGGETDLSYEEAVAILKVQEEDVTITATFTPAENGNFTGTQTATIKVTMVDITFEIKDGAVTEKENATYGDTWAEIVTIDESKIIAKAGNQVISGTYTLRESGMPNAGTRTYEVLFNGSLSGKEYTDVVVTNGTVNVAKKAVTVTALDRKIYVGESAPSLAQPVEGTDYEIDGLVGDDVLGGEIVMSYDPQTPDTTRPGSAEILISGAEGGVNYVVSHVSGKLEIVARESDKDDDRTENNQSSQVNPDGSVTTVTEKPDGTVIERTRYSDGTVEVVEEKKDGTVLITVTAPNGTKSETEVDPDGYVVSEVTVSEKAVEQAGGAAVALPVPTVSVVNDVRDAAVVTVNLPEDVEEIRVMIPVDDPTPGTVAMLVKAGGGAEVIKTSYTSGDKLIVDVADGDSILVVDNSQSFLDVAYTAWEYDAVAFVSSRGLFQGTGVNTFSPAEPTTRAMVMTVLARLDGYDTEGGATWYEKGMAWSMANGVSDGSNPNAYVTREQFATMLYRYAGSPAVYGTLSGFVDAGSISDYAQQAMTWAVQSGVMGGKGNGVLDPLGNATRAELSQMLMNFIVKVAR